MDSLSETKVTGDYLSAFTHIGDLDQSIPSLGDFRVKSVLVD